MDYDKQIENVFQYARFIVIHYGRIDIGHYKERYGFSLDGNATNFSDNLRNSYLSPYSYGKLLSPEEYKIKLISHKDKIRDFLLQEVNKRPFCDYYFFTRYADDRDGSRAVLKDFLQTELGVSVYDKELYEPEVFWGRYKMVDVFAALPRDGCAIKLSHPFEFNYFDGGELKKAKTSFITIKGYRDVRFWFFEDGVKKSACITDIERDSYKKFFDFGRNYFEMCIKDILSSGTIKFKPVTVWHYRLSEESGKHDYVNFKCGLISVKDGNLVAWDYNGGSPKSIPLKDIDLRSQSDILNSLKPLAIYNKFKSSEKVGKAIRR